MNNDSFTALLEKLNKHCLDNYSKHNCNSCLFLESNYPSGLNKTSSSNNLCRINRDTLDKLAEYCKEHSQFNEYYELSCNCPALVEWRGNYFCLIANYSPSYWINNYRSNSNNYEQILEGYYERRNKTR